MTVEHLASLIIVYCFFALLGGVAGAILGQLIWWVVCKCRKRRKEKIDDGAPSGY